MLLADGIPTLRISDDEMGNVNRNFRQVTFEQASETLWASINTNTQRTILADLQWPKLQNRLKSHALCSLLDLFRSSPTRD